MYQIDEIFLDSDGVVAGFDQYVIEHFGKPVSDFQKGTFWSTLERHNRDVQPFFRSLPKMSDADILMDYVKSLGLPYKILTACGYTPKDGRIQKIEWYAEHYPGVECIVVDKSPDKARYASPRALLIDDRNKSLDPWRAAGGIGILHTSAEDTIAQLSAMINGAT